MEPTLDILQATRLFKDYWDISGVNRLTGHKWFLSASGSFRDGTECIVAYVDSKVEMQFIHPNFKGFPVYTEVVLKYVN